MSSRLVVVFGRPSASLRSLLDLLRADSNVVVGGSDVRRFVESADDAVTRVVRAYTSAGEIVPAEVWAQLLLSVLPDHPAVLAGLLRDGADLRSLHRRTSRPMTLLWVEVAVAQVDAERAAQGLPPVEVGHPGASDRWDAALRDVARTAAQLGVPFVVVPGAPCSPARLVAQVRELLG